MDDDDNSVCLTQNGYKQVSKLIMTWVTGIVMQSLITSSMEPTWGPFGADRTQVGPMLAP